MPIDITNKEEKQIALTGAEIEETLLQAHLSKDAFEKINGLQASASEIDGSVNNKVLSLKGNDLSSLDADAKWVELTELPLWNPQNNGSNTPIFDNVSTFHKFGNTALRIGNTTLGASTTHGKNKALSEVIDLSDVNTFSFWVYCDGDMVVDGKDSSWWGQILLVLGDTNCANAKGANIFGTAGGGWHKGWNNITVNKDDFTFNISGTMNWSVVSHLQIRFTPMASQDGTLFHIDSIFFGGELPTRKIPVVITLDDSNDEAYSMTNIMNSHGVPVSLFVMSDEIEDHASYPGSMILSQIQKLYNKGNHIGMHNSLYAGFAIEPTLMLQEKTWLMNNGFTRDDGHLYGAYPNGILNQSAIDYAKSIGIKGLRSLSGTPRLDIYKSEATTSLISRESILNGGIADPYRINSSSPTTAALAISDIENAIAHKSGYITFHHTFSGMVNRQEWTTFAKYLKTKINDGTIECLTFPQFCKRYSN